MLPLKEISWERAIVAILLLLAIAQMPFGYYIFLKIVLCLAAAWEFHKATPIAFGRPLPMLWIIIIMVFNPVIPIPLRKESWMIIDGITAVIFAWAALLPHLLKTRSNP